MNFVGIYNEMQKDLKLFKDAYVNLRNTKELERLWEKEEEP